MKLEPVFKTEAELCAAFIEWARRNGYTAYPETAGWDILLVDKDGWQIGIEAKLRLNTTVLYQAIDCYNLDIGPDHRAVLVPELVGEWRQFCGFIGLEIFYCQSRRGDYWRQPRVHHFDRDNHYSRDAMFDWNPKKHCVLPDYIPDVAAGVPAPIQLTPWKVGALKVMAHLDVHGHITRKQISGYGIDNRRWCTEWLLPSDGDPKRGGNWVRGPACPRFDQQHATVYGQIRAEIAAAIPAGQLEIV